MLPAQQTSRTAVPSRIGEQALEHKVVRVGRPGQAVVQAVTLVRRLVGEDLADEVPVGTRVGDARAARPLVVPAAECMFLDLAPA